MAGGCAEIKERALPWFDGPTASSPRGPCPVQGHFYRQAWSMAVRSATATQRQAEEIAEYA